MESGLKAVISLLSHDATQTLTCPNPKRIKVPWSYGPPDGWSLNCYAQNPLDTFLCIFPVDGDVANLLLPCYGEATGKLV